MIGAFDDMNKGNDLIYFFLIHITLIFNINKRKTEK